MDFAVAMLMLITFPLGIFVVQNPYQFLKNILKVLIGRVTWVSYASTPAVTSKKFKHGILTPLDSFINFNPDLPTIERLNMLYAKEYNVYEDLRIIFKNLKKLEEGFKFLC